MIAILISILSLSTSMPTSIKDLAELTKLGNRAKASRTIEAFPNHAPRGSLLVTLDCREFTCMCPLTHQPDFATLEIAYAPDRFVAESKSMKLYLETFRQVGVFHEHLAVDIANDFQKFIKPQWVSVTVAFNVRGGIAIRATHSLGKRPSGV